MKRSNLLFVLGFVLMSSTAFAQANVRGWCKNGQVWIVWQVTHADSPQYAIYANRTSFANTRNATLIGRLFWQEWSGLRLKDTARSDTVTYKIPTDTGDYRLRLNEGLFVGTVTPADAGTRFFAVVRWGDSLVTANNRVSVTATYSRNEPPMCYEQYRGANLGYPFAIFNMWADGRDNDGAGRPDFPVMATDTRMAHRIFSLWQRNKAAHHRGHCLQRFSCTAAAEQRENLARGHFYRPMRLSLA